MCGIFGYASMRPPVVIPAWRAVFDCIAYRGPDAQGLYLAKARARGDELQLSIPEAVLCDPTQPEDSLRARWPEGPALLLGHLRLAIIDLQSASNQPMLRGSMALTFNGEIYNYIELRAELQALGHRFITKGDSEVILAAYEEWGRDCVHRLRGMFAFAIHDRGAGTLWLVRDRFAIKPLYLMQRQGLLAFASEAKALPLLLREPAVPNDRELYHLLVHRCYAFDHDSFYQDVEMVLPGEDIMVDLATLTLQRRRYYDLREVAPGLEVLPGRAAGGGTVWRAGQQQYPGHDCRPAHERWQGGKPR
jgi:asparagine synthase (glutamine-hydrolysing)